MTIDALSDALHAYQPRDEAIPHGKGSIDITPDGATINNVVVTSPILTDWTPVFDLFNLDAAEFEVVDDTVRMSTWQQSKRTEDGSRDGVQLYAYSARFRRVTSARIRPEVIAEWRQALKVKTRQNLPAKIDTPAGTYVVLVADPQLGKKGTAEAVENWQRGVLGHLDAARQLGPAVERIHVAFQGDETENVVNSYGNQPHTIELNRSAQLELDYDMRVWTIREALALRKRTSASSVVSNHGEWTRNGGKEPVTTRNDNASTFIARQVAKLFAELAPFTRREVEWTIGDTHPGVTLNLSGVDCYFSHGYVEKGKGASVETRTRAAIERQILGRTDELGDVATVVHGPLSPSLLERVRGADPVRLSGDRGREIIRVHARPIRRVVTAGRPRNVSRRARSSRMESPQCLLKPRRACSRASTATACSNGSGAGRRGTARSAGRNATTRGGPSGARPCKRTNG